MGILFADVSSSGRSRARGDRNRVIRGNRRLETMTKKQRSDAAKKTAEARWARKREQP